MFSESTQLAFRVNTKDFSCQSAKLNFYPYVLLGISLLKNSLSVELYNLLNSHQVEPISKSAYSQGRYKIQAELYQAWLLLPQTQDLGKYFKTWQYALQNLLKTKHKDG